MKLCHVENLKENDVIGKTVMTNDYQILLSEGTVLKKSYITKLKEMNIESVYIRCSIKENIEEITLLRQNTERVFKDKVRSVLEKHIYGQNRELSVLSSMADQIIQTIMENETLMQQVYDLRERSSDLYEHSVNVCALSVLTALKMKIQSDKIHDLAVSSLLHDIGLRYMCVPYEDTEILQTEGKNHLEYVKHPVYAYTSLKNEDWLTELSKEIILYHHENNDGTGFPLQIGKVSMEVTILSVCDVFDEMICGIGYKRKKVFEAIEYLKINKETMYNKKVVNTFLQFTAVFPVGSKVLLSDGEIAVVIKQNDGFPERPIISMASSDGIGSVTKDLMKHKTINIEKIL